MAKNAQAVDTTAQDVDQAISRTEQFVENNRNIIIYCLIGIIVVVAAIWGWGVYRSKQNAAAEEAIWPAQFLFEAQDYEQALAGFEDVIDMYGSTKAGNIARAYAGLCAKELGRYDDAVDYLKKFSGDDKVIAPAIQSALGDCLVNQENADYVAAARAFEKAASMSESAEYSPIYLRKAGLAYEAAGDKAAALKAYTAIKEQWLETVIGQSIDKYIYRVQQ